jgi:mRNA-degrading endonuclease RelE of RelBE toxin-antitoxin system
MLHQKIEEIRRLENPRSLGGAYCGKWGYPVGKFHVICQIDDVQRIVTIKTLVRLG